MMKSQYLAKLSVDEKHAFDLRMDEWKKEKDYVDLLIALQATIEDTYLIIIGMNRPDDDGLEIVKEEFCRDELYIGRLPYFNPKNPVKHIADFLREIPVSHLLLIFIVT